MDNVCNRRLFSFPAKVFLPEYFTSSPLSNVNVELQYERRIMAKNDNAAERTIMDFRELNSIVTLNR